MDVTAESLQRRTFAIISHPDAGKTTLTEKFLLYSGAVQVAGAVHAREGRRSARSDWMELEQQRGISISSTVLQFPYVVQGGVEYTMNLLDTPGHRDFSEDTYRVLSAVDAVVMVLDAAKGIEAQTLKLFQVCRSRNLPVITFLNKYDRPGRDPLELLDEIEQQITLRPTPVTWPVGSGDEFSGLINRRTQRYTAYTRTARGASEALEVESDIQSAFAAADTGTRRVWTPSSTSPLPPRRASTRPAARTRSTSRSARSCSRCRPTWTRRTATASRSPASAPGTSSAACRSPTRARAAT